MNIVKQIKTNGISAINEVLRDLYTKLEELKANQEQAEQAAENVVDEVEDVDDLREKAKALGIKSWHIMGKDRLTEEINKLENTGE